MSSKDENSSCPLAEQRASANDIAIRVSNLSKCYQIYETPRDRLKQFVVPRLQLMAGQTPKQYFREFWALKDVSFEIKKGETVGIIGRNGSGKSTLLQLICGTLSPTGGSVETNGRIAALLELGLGFNPEFTGRENVCMSCALLGLTPEEAEARFGDIAAFADIGDFIEQPVKTYSSGMYVRLAFAVNIVSNPDIMIVDEALSVGDMRFQARCTTALKRLKDMGTTLIFVSHDIAMVSSLCSHAIYLDGGELLEFGPSTEVTQLYQHKMREQIIKDQEYEIVNSTTDADGFSSSGSSNGEGDIFIESDDFDKRVSLYRDGTGGAKVTFVELLDEHGKAIDEVYFDQTVIIKIYFVCNIDTIVSPGYYIADKYNNEILGAVWVSVCNNEPINGKAADRFIASFVTNLPLQDGVYSISVELIHPVILDFHNIRMDDLSNAIVFNVAPRKNGKCWSKVFLHNSTSLVEFKAG